MWGATSTRPSNEERLSERIVGLEFNFMAPEDTPIKARGALAPRAANRHRAHHRQPAHSFQPPFDALKQKRSSLAESMFLRDSINSTTWMFSWMCCR